MRLTAVALLVVSTAASSQLTFDPAHAESILTPYMQVLDVDGDGVPDIASGSKTSIAVKFGVGDGTFGNATAIADRAGPFVFADFDGDGQLDLVHANPTPGPQSLSLSKGVGGLAFAAPVSLALPGGLFVGGPLATDFEGDGDVDLVYATAKGVQPGTLWAVRNDGVGVFDIPYSTQAGGFLSAPIWNGDLDGDGLDDLVFTRAGDTLYALATGAGDFTQPRDVAVDVDDVGDLVGDARVEIVGRSSAGGDERVVAFTIDGGGPVQTLDAISPVGEVSRLNVSDVDADGRNDLVATKNFSFLVGVVLVQGAPGSFEIGGWFQSTGGFEHRAVDVDADGRPDLVSMPVIPIDPLHVSLNRTYAPNSPFTDLGAALATLESVPLAVYAGSLGVGGRVDVALGNAPVGSAGFVVLGLTDVSLPLAGGVLVPAPDAVIGPFVVPNVVVGEQLSLGLPDVDLLGVDVFAQWWFVGDGELTATSAVRIDG